MLGYVARRLLSGLVTLLGITVVTFLVIRLAPGDAASLQAARDDQVISPEEVAKVRELYGLDRPVHEQYLGWLRRLATGDFGDSFETGQPVIDRIAASAWPTLSVSLISIVVAFLVSIPVGLASAARPGSWLDRVTTVLLYALYAVPPYVLGVVLILFLSVRWKLLPIAGMRSFDHDQLSLTGQLLDSARHYVLITTCATVGSLAYFSRFVRQNTLEVIRHDYVRTARAKGSGELRVVVRHAFANTLIPFVTLLGLTLPFVLSGSVILETIFSWPGLGRLFHQSVAARDYPTLMALNFLTATLVLVCTLLADLGYALVDPRVSYGRGR